MATSTHKIRIFVPFNGDKKPNLGSAGHYELQLVGNYVLGGRQYVNPVISYGGSNGDGSTGRIVIWNHSDRSIESGIMLCTCPFVANIDNPADAINDCLSNYCSYNESASDEGTGHVYDVITGPFKTYRHSSHNCFAALACWCSDMGYADLLEIWESSSSAASYYAWPMFLQNYSYWNIEELNNPA